MKRGWKGILPAVCAALLLIAVFVCGWVYLVWYMPTDILVSESEDGAYRVTVQRIGEPEANIYHAAHLRISVERSDGVLLDRRDALFLENDVSFRAQDCQVNWYPAGVEIRFEQPLHEYSSEYSTAISLDDLLYIPGWSKPKVWLEPLYEQPNVWTVAYDGGDFLGYTNEQALAMMQERYGSEIRLVEEEGGTFLFSTGVVEFHAVNDIALTDDFWERYTEFWAKGFSAAHNRSVYLDREGESSTEWVPTLSFSGRSSGEMERFARAACDLIESFMEDRYLSPDGKMPAKLCYSAYGEEFSVNLRILSGEYDRVSVYNTIYAHVEENSLKIYAQKVQEKQAQEQQKENQEGTAFFQGVELTDEIWERYLSIEPECTYVRPDGMELRLIAIDRALGSSFYILIAVSEDGSEYEVVNWDPYLGHGGQAMWISFPEEGDVGFIGLAYSGGAYGMLFRTEDGGRTFSECEYPSANVELPDGELYNPFVMPEKVFVEGSAYYLLAGQGPNGDYYGEKGYCKGLYWSADRGQTWKYEGEVPGVDIYLSGLYED